MKVTLIAGVFVAGLVTGGVWTHAQQPAPAEVPAQRVTGIGGVFFKAKDPKALSAWYRDTLGIQLQGGAGFALFEWREREDSERLGHTVWSLFPSTTKYFAPSEAAFMVNYRVRDLDRMLAQLRALGVRIEPKVIEDFNGRFAWIVDPEGNKIELWEPKAGY
jgi:catechol 2,3-dioxygenase-like lactoylglutathione lyase family enzyme